jgi:hypothetical protein
MPCCAASGSAGRINPWSVWIRSWEVSKIGRKKATLLCPRHGFCFFVWFSAVFCESFMAQAFFQEWKETIGRPRCRLATDLHLGTPWALLGHSLDFAHHGHPAVPPRQLREAERQTEINELVQAHDIRPWIRTWTTCRIHAVTCCYMLLISCLILSEAILISRTWGHLEASSNSIYVCFRFCQSSPKTFDRYKMASGGGLWKIQRFAKNLVGLKTDLKHIEIDWLESCQYLVTLPKGLEYDCRGIKVFLGSTASIEEKPVWVMVPYQVQRRRWTM